MAPSDQATLPIVMFLCIQLCEPQSRPQAMLSGFTLPGSETNETVNELALSVHHSEDLES